MTVGDVLVTVGDDWTAENSPFVSRNRLPPYEKVIGLVGVEGKVWTGNIGGVGFCVLLILVIYKYYTVLCFL